MFRVFHERLVSFTAGASLVVFVVTVVELCREFSLDRAAARQHAVSVLRLAVGYGGQYPAGVQTQVTGDGNGPVMIVTFPDRESAERAAGRVKAALSEGQP